ncbi:spore coat protein U domain-containing protein [Sphingomonas sp. HITSZ_GF]|uniref:spore coat protein U domain-containing protein n=1 Tax=Sphingomonas sp. HITSZ_GF TaxID=3037247 RepID=UPI00240DDF46|nr:spore coat U domain-containing protein [Sphingomonas sp. HITSZ_GF]MDG2535912.1 spore coat protein U domain-containing protein [Sphingomonas sp. HITSZ_GF]
MPVKLVLPAATALAALLGLAGAAHAADCTVQATPLVFGSYRPTLRGPTDVTATITVTCTASQAESIGYEIALLGTGRDALEAPEGGPALRFGIFVDATRLRRWGDGMGGTATLVGSMVLAPGERRSMSYTVYGRLAGGQKVRAGAYAFAPMITLRLS